MTQSLCARCLDPLPRARRNIGLILCDACDVVWRKEFHARWQRNDLDRAERRAAPTNSNNPNLLSTSD